MDRHETAMNSNLHLDRSKCAFFSFYQNVGDAFSQYNYGRGRAGDLDPTKDAEVDCARGRERLISELATSR